MNGRRQLLLVGTLAVVVVENDFAHAHRLGRNLHKLVFLDIFESLFEREYRARHDACLVVRAAGARVGQLFCLRHVYHEVVVVDMLAYHLACVDFLARVDEELAAVLQLVYRVCVGRARLHGYHAAVHAAGDVSLVRLVLLEAVSHDSLALTGGKHVGAQAYYAARRDVKLYVYPVGLALH